MSDILGQVANLCDEFITSNPAWTEDCHFDSAKHSIQKSPGFMFGGQIFPSSEELTGPHKPKGKIIEIEP